MLSADQESAPPPELAGLLEAMTSEGTLNSSGVFTIDVRTALPKLEKFQLPKPHFGLLKVIQSAVGSGASYVNASFGSTGILIEHDGRPPQPDQLRDLLSYLLSTDQASGDRCLRDLAIGVNTSLARGASWVEVSARDEGAWVSQRWISRDESKQAQAPQSSDGRARVRFVLRRTLSQAASEVMGWANKDLAGLFTGSRDVMDEDARAVFDRCRNAPVPVSINGRAIPPSANGHRVVRRWSPFHQVEHRRANLVEIVLQARQESPHLMSPPRESQARLMFARYGHFDGHTLGQDDGKLLKTAPGELAARRCFAVIGIRAGGRSIPGEMTVVKDGVDLTRLTPPGLPKGVSVLLTAEGLRLDLSQFRLVDSRETRDRLSWVNHQVRSCAAAILDLPNSGLASEEIAHLQRLVNETG